MKVMGNTTMVRVSTATGSITMAMGGMTTRHDNNGNAQQGDSDGRQDYGRHNNGRGQHGDGRHDDGNGQQNTNIVFYERPISHFFIQ